MWPYSLLVATLLLAGQPGSSLASRFNNATDRNALLTFKSVISDGSTPSLASWNDSIHFCRWQGITCGGQSHPQRVVSLVLSSLGLAGSISPAISNLTFLREIDLSNNRLHGLIPQETGRLFRLQYLNLSMNSLQGAVPETLSSCAQLQSISLRSNLLTGKIPSSLSRCSELRNINLSNNSLTGNIPAALTNLSSLSILSFGTNQLTGSIPPTIGNLDTLTALSLASNRLTGSIPPSIGKLSRLTALGLFNNQLTGEIPLSLWNLSSLSRLSLAYNNLSGSLPPNMGQALPLIESMDLYYNQLHGPIPSSLSNASSLQRFDFSFNRFTGAIPSNLGNLQNLEWVDLDGNRLISNEWSFLDGLTNCTQLLVLQIDKNNLGGVLPYSIANLSVTLDTLGLAGNQITGSISPEIGNLLGLTNLDLGPNLLTGPIPDSIGMLQNLRALDLDDNKLSGEIPATVGNLTELLSLFLDYNELSGNIPATLGNCRNLNLLNFESNKLTGSIPKEIFAISTLARGLFLSFNSLTGSIPSEIGNLKNLGEFDVSYNKLSGELPSSLGECQELERLFLRGNFFHGKIPSSLSVLRGIQELDVSQNKLLGRIPDFLQDFRFIFYLNLSFNNFEGEVPSRGIFANTSAFFALGNNNLCGGNPEMRLPACPSQSPSTKRNHSHRLILILSIVGSLVFLFLVLCSLVARSLMRKPRRKRLHTTSISEEGRIPYDELVRATDGFSVENLIGSGSFAKVYKGILDDERMKIVAVKVLNLQQEGASKSFMAECEALRNIRHRNLVKILAACSSVDPRGNEFKAVVLKFMANGSLNDWLHPKENEGGERKRLTLVQRLNIAIDVASALDYLHHHGETPIIHCDMKPSNVLLDEDMTAHVGDFGLSRILKEIASKSSHYSTNSTGLKGTIGYVPPVWNGKQSFYSGDVYSYGILLLEMFTAKSPTDNIFTEGLSLQKFVENGLPERFTDIIDARLLSLEGGEETDGIQSMKEARKIECIASLLRIGILCSKEIPAERLKMGEVIRELHKIKDVFLKNELRVANLKGEGSSRAVQY